MDISIKRYAFFFMLMINFSTVAFAEGFGGKIGIYFPGGLTVDDQIVRDFDTNSGLTFGIFYDKDMSDSFTLSPFADYSSYTVAADDAVTKFDFGVDAKFRIPAEGQFKFRAGGGIAFGIADFEVEPLVGYVTEESNTFFVYKAFIEGSKDKFLGELGFKGSTGGNEEYVDIHPGLYIRFGMMFN